MFNFLLAALTSALSISVWAQAQLLDRVVAVVDRNVIMQSQLDERMEQIRQRAAASGMGLPDINVLRSQILDHLIAEELQLQVARRVGFSVGDEQVNQAIEQIRQANNLTPEQFQRQLQIDGLSMTELRSTVRRDLTLQQIQQGIVQQRIHISPLEIDNFLRSAEAQFWVSPDYHLGHILIPLPQSPTAEQLEEAQAKAEELVGRVRGGENFAEVAIAESRGPDALQGGDMGWRKTSDLPSLFAEVVPNLEVGQVSEPFRSGAGLHILRLHDKRNTDQQLETQAHVRHILVKPSAILTNEEAEAKLRRLRQEILDGADFAAMAREHSEDIGSMLGGGDLGWSRPGMFVPAFEQVVHNIEVGEISQPFRSQFGWHILQVTARRDTDITQDLLRERAAQVLTSRRFEDELQLWQRELRDDAFVDIKI